MLRALMLDMVHGEVDTANVVAVNQCALDERVVQLMEKLV
jgi:hypothetical protein